MAKSTNNRLLFIQHQTPYASIKTQESVDALLAASAFMEEISLLFMDDGVWQILKQQQPKSIHRKPLTRIYDAIDLYEIENLYVDEASLTSRQLNPEDLFINATLLSPTQIQQLFQQHQSIIRL